MERFEGRIVHPQTWPDDLDYAGKRVIVIGSGATAATLDPGDRRRLRRTSRCCSARRPTSSPGRNANELADMLRELDIPEEWIHEIVRRKILLDQGQITRLSTRGARAGPRGAARPRSATVLGRRTSTSTPTSPRATGRGSSGSRSCPTATSSRASERARPRWSPTRSRRFTETGILLKSGEELDGRHHRHRHRVRPQRAGRHRLHGRRRAARLRRHRDLPRDDVHRRARTWSGSSATSGPAGRCGSTSSATSCAGCSTTWTRWAPRR